MKGNKSMQVTTSDKIYFYDLDTKTFEPTLQNVMNNFMSCSEMMFGNKGTLCITYKTNQKSFDIYRRKYVHNYGVNVVDENLDGSAGVQIQSMNAFLVSKVNVVKFYDVDTFQEMTKCRIEVPLFVTTTRESNQILSLLVS